MKRYYFTVVRQYLRKKSRFFILPVFSLGLAVAVALIATLDITHEKSFDKFQSGFNNIFQLYVKAAFNGEVFEQNTCSYACGSKLMNASGAVQSICRIQHPYTKTIISSTGNIRSKYQETNFCFGDANFFQLFSFPLLSGSAGNVLQNPYSVVITRKIADKYFGKTNPIGESLIFNGKFLLQVTGVAYQAPSNSSIQFDFVCPISTLLKIQQIEKNNDESNDVTMGMYETYVSTTQKINVPNLERSLKSLSLANMVSKDSTLAFRLVPLKQIHDLQIKEGSVGSAYSIAISIILAAILLIAIINYIIFTVAKAGDRYKEIGMRKLLGASVSQIGLQFFLESTLITGIAIMIGIILFVPLKLLFERVTNSHIDNNFLFNKDFIGGAMILVSSLVLATSIYPAFVAARFNPLKILSGLKVGRLNGFRLGDVFVGLQFMICGSCLIICLVVYKQINFLKTYSDGINRNNVVVVPFDLTLGHNFRNVITDLRKLSGIEQVCAAHYSMFKGGGDELTFKTAETGKKTSLSVYLVDQHFTQILGLKFQDRSSDSLEFSKPRTLLLNTSAVEKLELGPKPIAKDIYVPNDNLPFTVGAIVKNFNFLPLRENIGPLGLLVRQDTSSEWGTDINGVFMIRTQKNSNLHSTIEQIKAVYNKYDQETPFSFSFLDDNYKSQYENETRLSNTFFFLTAAAILLSCFGLYSFVVLIGYSAIKPNSIRKLLGASVVQLMLSSTHKLIVSFLIAVAIFCPVCAIILNKWLHDFAFRISLPVSYFALAVGILFLISAFTISFEIRKLLNRSVVDGLRE